MLQPKAVVQPLAWRRAHPGGCSHGHMSMAERFSVPPLKQVLLGAESGSLSLSWGFHLPQHPWAEKLLTQGVGGKEGLTLGQDLAGESGQKHSLEMPGIKPRTSHMQSRCSATELHPLDACQQETLSSHRVSMTSTVLLSPGCPGTLCRKQPLNPSETGEVGTASLLGSDPGPGLHCRVLPLQHLCRAMGQDKALAAGAAPMLWPTPGCFDGEEKTPSPEPPLPPRATALCGTSVPSSTARTMQQSEGNALPGARCPQALMAFQGMRWRGHGSRNLTPPPPGTGPPSALLCPAASLEVG